MTPVMTQLEIINSFRGRRCAVCQGSKKPDTGFCFGCYYSLPKELSRALWKRFGAGFEEAYLAAKTWLHEANRD
jgi:hypothetical protein